MAQFDVYANPSKAQRGEIPWMVEIQSEILDKLPTRLVMPLAPRTHMAAMPRPLCPTIGWNGSRTGCSDQRNLSRTSDATLPARRTRAKANSARSRRTPKRPAATTAPPADTEPGASKKACRAPLTIRLPASSSSTDSRSLVKSKQFQSHCTCSSRGWNINPAIPLIDDGRRNIFAGDDRLTNLSRRR